MPIPGSIEAAPQESRQLLATIRDQLGVVPNMFRLVSNSPPTLEGYLGLSGALAKGTLDACTRARIAIAVAQLDGSDYCLSAHTYLGKTTEKLEDAELAANRKGTSNDEKAERAVRFAAKLVWERGHVSEDDVAEVRRAGYSDGEILEIIGHVALNTFTNYVNVALGTAIDFPMVRAR